MILQRIENSSCQLKNEGTLPTPRRGMNRTRVESRSGGQWARVSGCCWRFDGSWGRKCIFGATAEARGKKEGQNQGKMGRCETNPELLVPSRPNRPVSVRKRKGEAAKRRGRHNGRHPKGQS